MWELALRGRLLKRIEDDARAAEGRVLMRAPFFSTKSLAK
jgi:hypothetical protein